MAKIIKLPGLIDSHVHLRDLGQTHKEDFYSGSSAAIAGGFTTVLDMPNNIQLIDSKQKLQSKINSAKEKIICDVGFYFGSLGDNLNEFNKVANEVKGLKLYLSNTTGGYIIDRNKVEDVFKNWPKDKAILLHAEDDSLDFVLNLVSNLKNKVHICHVSLKKDLEKILRVKEKGLPISCGVTPHHLFLTEGDVERLGSLGLMKPPLAKKSDQDFLWKHLQGIDMIESDHAPHTLEEKGIIAGEGRGRVKAAQSLKQALLDEHWREGDLRQDPHIKPAFGVPNLETTLPLLLTAVHEHKLTLADIKRLCHTSPAECFHISICGNTTVEVDLDQEYAIENKDLKTKCGWSPFAGYKVKGKVEKVIFHGKTVFENDTILAKPGSGNII